MPEDSSGRPSVLLTFTNDLPEGMVFSCVSTNGGVGSRLPTEENAAVNIHGNEVFVVKAQTTGDDTAEFVGKVVIYDQERSFTLMKVAPELRALVLSRGVRGGIKAYCEARREGDRLRVYVDEPVSDSKRTNF